MKSARRLALAALLCLPVMLASAMAFADSFELSDPANEMYQEWQEEEKEYKEEAAASKDAVCAVDLDNGMCSCVDPETEEVLPLSRDACLDIVAEAAAAAAD